MSSYEKSKGRNSGNGSFLRLPHAVMDCPNFLHLSTGATRLLLDMGRQFNGKNNGDLCAAFTVMKKRGWTSAGSVQNAKEELRYYGFIELTRPGGRNTPHLYAFTWLPVNEIKGKPEIVETRVASGIWKEPRPPFVRKTPRKINSCTHHMSASTHQAEQ